MFDVLHTVINSVYVQTSPAEQATSVVTDYFAGHDPFAHACEARANDCWTDFSECVIVMSLQLLEETLAVLSLCKLSKDHGYSYEWVSGQDLRLTKNGKKYYPQD